MFLESSHEINFTLDAAADNDNVEAVAWYEDYNEETQRVTHGINRETGNGTTAVVLVDAVYTDDSKERTVRKLKGINFFNADDATRTVNFFFNDGTTSYDLCSFALLTKEHCLWTPEAGWRVLQADGRLKTQAPLS